MIHISYMPPRRRNRGWAYPEYHLTPPRNAFRHFERDLRAAIQTVQHGWEQSQDVALPNIAGATLIQHLQHNPIFRNHPGVHFLIRSPGLQGPLQGHRYEENYIVFNNRNFQTVLENVRRQLLHEEEGEYRHELVDVISNHPGDLEIRVFRPRSPSREVRAGSFFPYINKSWMDLKRYGIYQELPEIEMKQHCFIQALERSEVCDQFQIDTAALYVGYHPLRRTQLKELAIKCHLRLRLTTFHQHSERVTSYPRRNELNEDWPEVALALFEHHYFLNEETTYTEEDAKQWEHPPQGLRRVGRRLRSGWLIYHLYRYGAFEAMTLSPEVFQQGLDIHLNQTQEDVPLLETEQIDGDLVKASGRQQLYDDIVYFDIETDTSTCPDTYHIPYAVSWYSQLRDRTFFYMIHDRREIDDLGRLFLTQVYQSIPGSKKVKRIILIAHNAQYDFQILVGCCHPQQVLRDGSRMKSWMGWFYPDRSGESRLQIFLKDSYLMIPLKLEKFGETFNLDIGKDWFPYDHYTIDAIEHRYPIPCPTEEMFLRDEKSTAAEKYQAWREEARAYFLDNGMLDMESYARHYCSRDVDVLREGYQTFRQWILKISGLDILDYITLSHLAKNVMVHAGCFEDVFTVNQNVMLFMRNCVVGGRNMVRENKACIIDDVGLIEDQDVNSLYPTAMYRMPGFLKGFPERLPPRLRGCDDFTFQPFLEEMDGCFIKILILHVGIQRPIPLLYRKTKEGIIEWTNHMEQQIMFVCKTTLEDLIQYHDIHYQVMDGYYYRQGFNTKIRDLIGQFFEARAQKKREGNPIEMAYKLLMNSFYGVTLQRPITTVHKFCEEKHLDRFFVHQHPWIEQFHRLGTSYFKPLQEKVYYEFQMVKSLYKISNLPHVGAEILAWSKRHMNEIIYLADDLDIPIYYTDTDSLHLPHQELPLLMYAYERMYDRPLCGEALGQCSSEWKRDVQSIKGYFLSKKIYCDVLTNGTIYFKMKGVTKDAVKALSEQTGETIPQLYQRLYEGEMLTFHNGHDAQGHPKSTFKRRANGTFSAMEEHYLIKRIKIDKHS